MSVAAGVIGAILIITAMVKDNRPSSTTSSRRAEPPIAVTAPATTTVDVVGSLCENNDKFAIDRMLPEIEIGDIAVIHDTGAHGHSMGYNYNGRLRSAELLLKAGGEAELIRRAETPEDYFATLDFTHLF